MNLTADHCNASWQVVINKYYPKCLCNIVKWNWWVKAASVSDKFACFLPFRCEIVQTNGSSHDVCNPLEVCVLAPELITRKTTKKQQKQNRNKSMKSIWCSVYRVCCTKLEWYFVLRIWTWGLNDLLIWKMLTVFLNCTIWESARFIYFNPHCLFLLWMQNIQDFTDHPCDGNFCSRMCQN